jgi:hypothetical protein
VSDDLVAARNPSALASRARRGLLVLVAGLTTGVLTLLGQAVLDGDWNRLANSGAIWVTVAFAVGAAMVSDRDAAIAGIATLLLALVGYSVAASLAHSPLGGSAFVIWAGTALVGGPVFGLAGRRWRVDPGWTRVVSIALLGAVFAAEGLYTLWVIPDLARAGWVEVVLGIGVPIVLGRDLRERATALALLVPLSLLGLLAYAGIDRVFLLR